MRGTAILLGSLFVGALWTGVIAPLIARAFGIPLAFGFWRNRHDEEHLTTQQRIWIYGAFRFGIGMFLWSITWDYLDWQLLGDVSSDLRLHRLVTARLMIWLIAGLLVGALSVRKRRALGHKMH